MYYYTTIPTFLQFLCYFVYMFFFIVHLFTKGKLWQFYFIWSTLLQLKSFKQLQKFIIIVLERIYKISICIRQYKITR
jgi:hypothetical protein